MFSLNAFLFFPEAILGYELKILCNLDEFYVT